MELCAESLREAGATDERVAALVAAWAAHRERPDEVRWRRLRAALDRTDPPAVHHLVYRACYADRGPDDPPGPACWPAPGVLESSHAGRLLRSLGLERFEQLHAWSIEDRGRFWKTVIEHLGVVFDTPPEAILRRDGERACWLPGARFNIARCALAGAAERPAIVWADERGGGGTISRGALSHEAARVAGALVRLGLEPGDAVAICAPMHARAVAAYLGAVQAGLVVVSIADSFSAAEIATRLELGGARLVLTEREILRGGRTLPLLDRVREACARLGPRAPRRALLSSEPPDGAADEIGAETLFGGDPLGRFVPRAASADMNVLFSSGTTGSPKAIPWSHTTPLKCAMDGRYHHDIREGDVVCWPTNLGWMMGPWLIFASLMNGAAMALFDGGPHGVAFTRFVERARVTMLGVVPSLVRAWIARGSCAAVDWGAIRCFSSTGECSQPADMLWLMAQAGYRPVIEYCGGTEIGGGYITGSLLQPAVPSAFSTKALGLDFVLLDEAGRPARNGEVFLIGPSIGLSERLLHRSHDEVYFDGTPRGPRGERLRRHGDRLEALPGGYWRALGRVDDTMNLGGIKVSSAEIERVCARHDAVAECAAIAVPPPGGGPSRLVVYCVPESGRSVEPASLARELSERLRTDLNPLFRVDEVLLCDALPRTASNKVMRRVLRRRYAEREGQDRRPEGER